MGVQISYAHAAATTHRTLETYWPLVKSNLFQSRTPKRGESRHYGPHAGKSFVTLPTFQARTNSIDQRFTSYAKALFCPPNPSHQGVGQTVSNEFSLWVVRNCSQRYIHIQLWRFYCHERSLSLMPAPDAAPNVHVWSHFAQMQRYDNELCRARVPSL